MPEPSNARAIEPVQRHHRKCTARKTNGIPCERWAIAGGTVCPMHGGRSPHVKRKARQRLEEASDRMARELLGMATNPNTSEPVRLNAIRDALSRAGISERTAVEVEVGLAKPYEQILSAIEGGSRAEYRRNRGIPDDTPPLLVAAAPPLDVEIVDEALSEPLSYQYDEGEAEPGDTPVDLPAADTAPGPSSLFGSSEGNGGLMPFDEAALQARKLNARMMPIRRR